MNHGYRPNFDSTADLKADSVKWYQELMGMLMWAVEIGRIDILTEKQMLSQHIAMPR